MSRRSFGSDPKPRLDVPLLDLRAQYLPIRTDVERAIREVCDTQRFVLGPKVAELERRVAEYSHARYGIGVSSGTDALLVALMALGIEAGDEVVTTPYTFFATAGVIARLGARPVFCDIDAESFNLSPAAVEEFLSSECARHGDRVVHRRTGGTVKAIVPVHLYGQMAEMDALIEIARRYGLAVVEDAAQAIGAELPDGRRAGSLGDIGCFSFFPTKNLGAFGDAGMCVTNDAELARKLEVLRVHGGEPKYYHAVIGGNFRLDELQAAVLLVKLAHLDAWTRARQANAERYTQLLAAAAGAVETPRVVAGRRHIFNQYVIRASRRDELRAYLAEQGIGTEIYYPVPLHRQQCFAYLGTPHTACPVASKAAEETLALPVYPELSAAQIDYVADRIAEFYAGEPTD
ncbi:MAG TPA: DegT/DnrJ/EryC1/StrS family aminotransferase [Gammaproteobacteria bacterium]